MQNAIQGTQGKTNDHGDQQGRDALSPWQMGWPAWKQVLLRTWGEAGDDNVGLIAAGVAFYSFLALVPLLGAIVLSYGLIANPANVVRACSRADVGHARAGCEADRRAAAQRGAVFGRQEGLRPAPGARRGAVRRAQRCGRDRHRTQHCIRGKGAAAASSSSTCCRFAITAAGVLARGAGDGGSCGAGASAADASRVARHHFCSWGRPDPMSPCCWAEQRSPRRCIATGPRATGLDGYG